jgi:ketosteroid isomerase-like protein
MPAPTTGATEQVIERGNDLVAVVRQSGRGHASGVVIETRIAHVWTVADGRAVRWEAVPDPDDALGDNLAR